MKLSSKNSEELMRLSLEDSEKILSILKQKTALDADEVPILSNCIWAFITDSQITKKKFLDAMKIVERKLN